MRTLITDAAQNVEAGTTHVDQSGERLGEIVGSVKRVADMMLEIATASREQRTGVDQVTASVTEVDKVTQSNASETEQLSTTAQALSAKAARLQELVSAFDLGAEVEAQRSAPPAPPKPASVRLAIAVPPASETRQRYATAVARRVASRR